MGPMFIPLGMGGKGQKREQGNAGKESGREAVPEKSSQTLSQALSKSVDEAKASGRDQTLRELMAELEDNRAQRLLEITDRSSVENAKRYLTARHLLNQDGVRRDSYEHVLGIALIHRMTQKLGYLLPKSTQGKVREMYEQKSNRLFSILLDILHGNFVLCKNYKDLDKDTFVDSIKSTGVILGIELGDFNGNLPTKDQFIEVLYREVEELVEEFNEKFDQCKFDMSDAKIL